MNQSKNQLRLNLASIVGILAFVVLFYYSSTMYPGGSQKDLSSTGFDWVNNYWCNLMSKKAMNGQPNPARPLAIGAMVILCSSIAVFFFQFANVIAKANFWAKVIGISGVISMFFAVLMFTDYHDLMTIVASFFGLFAVIGILREIARSRLFGYKVLGIVCVFLLVINNVIYYTSWWIEWLPLVQKITFAAVLSWILGVNIEIRKRIMVGLR